MCVGSVSVIMASSGTGSPCGACKFLRRKCASECIFAPYFCSEQGPAQFAAIHKVFGASNVSKMLSQVSSSDRCEAVVTIAYEAQARIRDPVYGCVAHIFALQQQVALLQAQVVQMKAQLVYNNNNSRCLDNQYCTGSTYGGGSQNMTYPASYMYSVSPQSSLDSIENNIVGTGMREVQQANNKDDLVSFQNCNRKKLFQNELGDHELEALAIRMMRN